MNENIPTTLEYNKPGAEERARIDAQIAETQASLGSLEALAAGPKENIAARGPRNLPRPDARKRRRQAQRRARRANRS